MPQDALFLYHTANELSSQLVGGKVNKIIMPDAETLLLFVFCKGVVHKLLISASAEHCRAHITDGDYAPMPSQPPFCQLLRKYLSGAVIENICLVGFDRVMQFDFESKTEFEKKTVTLYAEIMGRHSNLFFVLDGKILGLLKSAGLDENSKRALFVGAPYTVLQQDKVSPLDISSLKQVLSAYNNSALFLQNNISGISPFTAQIFQAKLEKTERGMLAEKFSELAFFNISPIVIYNGGSPTDFFIRPIDGFEYFEQKSFSAAVDLVFRHKISKKQVFQLKNGYLQALKKRLAKAEKILSTLLDEQFSARDYDEFKVKGDLIINNIYKIAKKQAVLETDDYSVSPPIKYSIKLDENLTPSQNAKIYYKKYTKKKNAFEISGKMIAPKNDEVEYLRGLISRVCELESLEDLQYFADKTLLNQSEKKVKQSGKRSYFRKYTGAEFNIRVGRNDIENDLLIRQSAPDDIWLHTKNYRSAHTVIECGKKTPPLDIIIKAAEICAFFSEANKGEKVEVDYCAIKFVKRQKGAKVGLVNYTDFKTLTVKADKHEQLI